MPQIMTYIVDVNGPLSLVITSDLMQKDRQANTIKVLVQDRRDPVDLTGWTALYTMEREDGVRVVVEGQILGNEISVNLTDACYQVAGRYAAFIRITSPDTEEKRTVLRMAGLVVNEGNGPVIDGSGIIPSLEDLLAQIAAMEEATEAANKAAERAENAAGNIEIPPEAIQDAVNAYMEENPVESVSPEEIAEAVDAALQEAKESGDFDGEPGENGISPTVTTSKNGKVTTLTIKDANGTKTANINDGADGYTPVKGKDYFDGDPGVSATHKWDGTTLTITSASGTSSADLKGDPGDPGYTPVKGKDYSDGEPGYTPVRGTDYWTDADKAEIKGYVDETAATIGHAASVKALGAKGNGTADDTAIFQAALAGNRRVFVPGGTYKLSGELIVRDNCELELAQDAVLNFTNTSGNCVTLYRSATLRGNHATINVPYAFAGNVINADTTAHTSARDVPPWTHWTPQWKTARYVTDINVCKPGNNDIHQSNSGENSGTAVYICSDGSATSTFIWGLNYSGLRIAGAFEYGIRAIGKNNGWNHEARIEAFIDACKIGVSLEDCNKLYVSAAIQPRKAADGTVYAQHGIQLVRSIDTDLSGSRVWDWNDKNSLWTFDKTNVNQHIAMYGNCKGTILNDYMYHNIPTGFDDLRELIYTDTPANFESLIIVQEPFTKWFKPVNGEPYFNNGDGNERIVLKKEQDALFQTDYVPQFTDKLYTAEAYSGGILNEVGYYPGKFWYSNGTTIGDNDYCVCIGLIPAAVGSVVRAKGMKMSGGGGEARVILYNSAREKIVHINSDGVTSGSSYFVGYTGTEDGFELTIKAGVGVAYFSMNVDRATFGANPVITVDEEIVYTQVGTLASGIMVNEQSIFGMEKYERKGRMVTAISSGSTDAQYPSAKAVYTALQDALGAYVDEVAALIGGDA